MGKLQVGSVGEIDSNLGRRDAFHAPAVLVRPTLFNGELVAGSYARFTHSGGTVVELCSKEDSHGVIDPFIDGVVKSWQQVWMLLNPDQVTNLVHTFEIKALAVPEVQEEEPQAEIPFIPEEEPEEDEDDDDGCGGCYDTDDEEDPDDSCRGCY